MEYSIVAVLLCVSIDPISEYWVALCCLDRVFNKLPDITGVLSNVLERLEIRLLSTYFTQLESDVSFMLTRNGLFAMLQIVICWMSLMKMFVMILFGTYSSLGLRMVMFPLN
eukprot:NODE_433_length_8727_cov_0.399397.p5 type:complete len:112 gc:universal NODE_433_length_8727_cov_0.399397:8122-7787(-)